VNEILFFIHVALVMGFGYGALKMGKAALTAWIALQAVLANLFVIKQICFFGFHVTCSDVFTIGSIFGLNLLREYYGQDIAKKALWTCFFAMIFFAMMAQIHLLYLPSSFDTAHLAFETILSPSPRLLIASMAVFILVQQIDLRLFGFLKEKFHGLPLSIRNVFSVSITQFLDTFLFSIFGLWGLVAHLSDVILISFLIKLVVIALMTPLIHFSKRFIPQTG
jgi:queuosine precursor transporter